MDNGVVIFTAVIVLFIWLYKRFLQNDHTLADLGIVHETPLPFVGNILSLLSGREGGVAFFERVYQLFPNEK